MPSITVQNGDSPFGGTLKQEVQVSPDGKIIPTISSVASAWRSEFMGTGVPNSSKWQLDQTGTGTSATVSNLMLTMITGTSVDAEVMLTSQQSFTVPFRAMVGLSLSARNLGQSFYVEVISVDPVTGLPDGAYSAAWNLSGTTATQGQYEVQAASMPRLQSAASTITTTASAMILELELTPDSVEFHSRAMDSTVARGNSYCRHQNIPGPDSLLKLRIRAKNRQYLNGVTAIANNGSGLIRITRNAHGLTTGDTVVIAGSTGCTEANGTWTNVTVIDVNNFDISGSFTNAWTGAANGWTTISKSNNTLSSATLTGYFAAVLDHQEITAEITAGRGGITAGGGVGVNVNSSVALNVSSQGVVGENSATIANPTMMGLKAITAAPTAVTAGRYIMASATMYGSIINKNYSIPEFDWQYAAAAGGIVDTTDVVAKAANATLRNYVTGLSVINTSAAATEFVIKDGAVVIWRTRLPANMADTINVTFPTPLRGSLNTALNLACITTGSATFLSAQGYSAP